MKSDLPRPLRLGVIGAGGIAQSGHLPALIQLREHGWDVSVAAIADPDPARIAGALRILAPSRAAEDCQSYSEGASLLAAGNLDAVLLLTPPDHTPALLEQALALGIPALAEKPCAPNANALARLIQVEKNAVRPYVRIGYNRHSLPLVPPFLERLGELRAQGGVVHVEARLWRVQRSDAIFYSDTMVHALDFLRWSLGPLSVQNVVWWPPRASMILSGGLHVALHSPDSAPHRVTAHLDVRPAVGRELETYEVLGETQTLKLVYPPVNEPSLARLDYYEQGKRRSLTNPGTNDSDGLIARGFLPQLADFLLQVAGDSHAGAQLCTLTQAHDTALLKEQILPH